MARKKRIPVNLNPGIYEDFPKDDIHMIIRGADELIYKGGRSMLTKLLKGSKDKKILAIGLDNSPAYGYFSNRTLKDIQERVDWVIYNDYLTYGYDGSLPLLVHTPKGWSIVKKIHIDEFLSRFDIQLLTEEPPYDMFYLKDRNRELILEFLDRLEEEKDLRYIPLLVAWKAIEYKKIISRIEKVILETKQ